MESGKKNIENVENVSDQRLPLKGSAEGIFALAFSILSLFFWAIVFMPAAMILTAIALAKKQYVWAVITIAVISASAFTSPSMWYIRAMLGLR